MKYLLTSFFLVLLMGCGTAQKKSNEKTNTVSEKKSKTDFLVTIETPHGTMEAILYDQTPKHKENFLKLIKEDFYDSLLFHRVIKGFMIQGGDPDSKGASASKRLGTGGPGYTVPAEIKPNLYHKKGALSAARMGDQMNPQRNSSGSQFYIVQGTILQPDQLASFENQKSQAAKQRLMRDYVNQPENKALLDSLRAYDQRKDMKKFNELIVELEPIINEQYQQQGGYSISQKAAKDYSTIGGAPHLDNEYTVFGEIVTGLEVIDKIANVQTQPGDRPVDDVWMAVSVEEMSKKEITKKTGYIFQ